MNSKGECEECKKETLQRKSVDGRESGSGYQEVPSIVHEVLRSNGQPLDPSLRNSMESRLGHDFSQVRIHTDVRAGESASSVGANAYTAGHRIVFAPQQFRPETETGRHLIAHELAHVIQQRDAGVGNEMPNRVSNPSDIAERQADAAADGAVNSVPSSLAIGAGSGGIVQRDKADDSQTGDGQRVSVSIAVRGTCSSPEKIAEAIPGARTMLVGAENWFINYPFLESTDKQRFDRLLQAHFGSSSADTRHSVHAHIIGMSRAMESAMNAGITFDCTDVSAQHCAEGPWEMWVDMKDRSVIHVCKDFFKAGLEERRFTLIHETAHLVGVGDKGGYIRTFGPIGTAECLQQTQLSTADALNNADSHVWMVWCLTRAPGIAVVPVENISTSKP
jgi:hypothetical protein